MWVCLPRPPPLQTSFTVRGTIRAADTPCIPSADDRRWQWFTVQQVASVCDVTSELCRTLFMCWCTDRCWTATHRTINVHEQCILSRLWTRHNNTNLLKWAMGLCVCLCVCKCCVRYSPFRNSMHLTSSALPLHTQKTQCIDHHHIFLLHFFINEIWIDVCICMHCIALLQYNVQCTQHARMVWY